MSEASQGPARTISDRLANWRSIAEGHAKEDRGYALYSGDWASLAATLRAAQRALAVPEVWSNTERDGMAKAFSDADGGHGHYETLFAVAAWLLHHRASGPA
jgi:hypothetical protein